MVSADLDRLLLLLEELPPTWHTIALKNEICEVVYDWHQAKADAQLGIGYRSEEYRRHYRTKEEHCERVRRLLNVPDSGPDHVGKCVPISGSVPEGTKDRVRAEADYRNKSTGSMVYALLSIGLDNMDNYKI